MGYDIRLPNITASTERGQLEQIRAYLYQFAEQLSYAVNVIELNTSNAVVQAQTASASVADPTPEQRIKQFNNLKNLIISSADIVNAYSEKISYELSGEFVAQSEFGTYKEVTTKQVEENSKNLTQYYEKLEDIDGVQKNTSAYIRTGYLNIDGEEIAGVEIGMVEEGEAANKENSGLVRFLPTKTVFYSAQGKQMAVLSNNELIIDGIVCKGNFYVKNFVQTVDPVHGFSIKPTGRAI